MKKLFLVTGLLFSSLVCMAQGPTTGSKPYPGTQSNGRNGITIQGEPTAPTDAVPYRQLRHSTDFPGVVTFGDSNCVGWGVANTLATSPLGWCDLVRADMGFGFQPYGTYTQASPGLSVTDNFGLTMASANFVLRSGLPPFADRNVPIIEGAGINDATKYGADTDLQGVFRKGVRNWVSWFATGPYKTMSYNYTGWTGPLCTYTGTWDYIVTASKGTVTNGDSASCAITTYGGAIYLTYTMTDGNGGYGTVSIDGTVVDTIQNFGPNGKNIITNNNVAYIPVTSRYPVAAGAHTVVLTNTSPSDANNKFSFRYLSTCPPASALLQIGSPKVYLTGVLRYKNDDSAAVSAAYNQIKSDIVTEARADGCDVTFVDVRAFVNGTTDMYDSVHMNTTGHRKFANAVLNTIFPAGLVNGPGSKTPKFVGQVTTTATVTSNALTGVSGLTTSGFCMASPNDATAVAMTGVYAAVTATGTVTVYHSAETAGHGVFNVYCTYQ